MSVWLRSALQEWCRFPTLIVGDLLWADPSDRLRGLMHLMTLRLAEIQRSVIGIAK